MNILSQFRLDEGEAATYALFDAKRHKAILTDDGELIKLSKKEALSKLENLHGIGRYSKGLYEHFKSEVK